MNFDTVALAQGVFDAMVAQLAADATFVMPTRRYIATGDVAYDCNEFIVHGVRIFQGFPGLQLPQRTLDSSVWSLELGVSVVRCVPVPSASAVPSAEALDASGKASLADGGALMRAAVGARKAGVLLAPCSDVEIGPVTYGVPQGGLVGVTLTMTAQL